MVFATAAGNFSTSELQKLLRNWHDLHISTTQCAFRHTGVQFLVSPLSSYLCTRLETGLLVTEPLKKKTPFWDFSNIWREVSSFFDIRAIACSFCCLDYHFSLQRTSPVLQSTSPALLRTTKYYYSVLQTTAPVLLRGTKDYSVLQRIPLHVYFALQSSSPVLQVG